MPEPIDASVDARHVHFSASLERKLRRFRMFDGYVCRLLGYMDRHNVVIAVPRWGASVQPQPFLNFTSGYVQRAQHLLPKQGSRAMAGVPELSARPARHPLREDRRWRHALRRQGRDALALTLKVRVALVAVRMHIKSEAG